jgi:eukaryotic-like serine/threonine-protein kinase
LGLRCFEQGTLIVMKEFGFVAGMILLTAVSGAQEKQGMFRGNVEHSGVYQSRVPKQLSLKWTFSTAGPIVSSPTVVDGIVYAGSADRNLYAVDAETGKLRWKFDAHGDVNSSPAVVDGVVYVVSLDGNLYAIDAASGKQRWSFATEGERRFSAVGYIGMLPVAERMTDPWDFYLSSPAVVNGIVYFGSGDGNVYAVAAESGSLRWKYKTGDVVHSSPAVSGGVVYVGSWDTYFYALNATDGELIWRFKTGDDAQIHLMTGIQGSAAVVDGTVCFGSRDAKVYALNAKTGALKWKFANGSSWVISSPAMVGDRVYFTTSDSFRFQALDALTGKAVYSLPYGIYSFSSPAVAGSHAYFGAFDGRLYDVDLEKQSYAGRFATPGFDLNGRKYLGPDGKLMTETVWMGDTVDNVIADLRGKVFSMGSILSSPVVSNGRVYFGSVDGNLYAIGQ